jgi:hypothetical protein
LSCYEVIKDESNELSLITKINSVLNLPFADYSNYQFLIINSIFEETVRTPGFSIGKKAFPSVKAFFLENFIKSNENCFKTNSRQLIENLHFVLGISELYNEIDFMAEMLKYVVQNAFNENTMYLSNQEEAKELLMIENEAKLLFYENLSKVELYLLRFC